MLKTVMVCLAWLGLFGGSFSSVNATAELKRSVLQKVVFPPGSNRSMVLILIEGDPNLLVPRHTHPGLEEGYVVEGAIEFTIGDQPPHTYKKGDSYMIPEGVPHNAKFGPKGAKFVGAFEVETDKPLATPVP